MRPSDQHPRGQPPEGHPSADEAHQQPETTESPCQDAAFNETETHPGETPEQQPSNPAFQPFFTLIEDAQTSDYHHPTVHYIFSDDDAEIVTEAALRSLASQQESLSDSKKDQIAQAQVSSPHDETEGSSGLVTTKTALLPPPVPGVRENYLILDVEPSPPITDTAQTTVTELAPGKSSGTKSLSSSPANPSELPPEQSQPHSQYRVTAAQSFSSTWQVLNTEVVPAPTFENGSSGASPGQGLMLRIRGTGGLPVEVAEKDKESKLEEMMDQFAKRMSELQIVIDAAEAAASENQGEGVLQYPFSPDTGNEIAQGDPMTYAAGNEVEAERS